MSYQPIGFPSVLRGLAGRDLDEFGLGTVERTGTADMAPLINDAIELAVAIGDPVTPGRGIHRLESAIRLRSGLRWHAHTHADFVGCFSTAGANGMVMPASDYVWDVNPLSDVEFSGGIYRRLGEVAGDNNELWTGNTGNVFAGHFNASQFRDFDIRGYAGGRGFHFMGDDITLDNIRIWNPDAPQNMATPVTGGTGGFRFFYGRNMRATRLFAICGDDCFQFVPGAATRDTVGCIYENCWGHSTAARVIVAGLGDRSEGFVTNSVRNCTFRFIRGKGPTPISLANTESSGELDVLLDDVVIEQILAAPHKESHDPPGSNAVAIALSAGNEPTQGLTRVTMRRVRQNVLAGGISCSGSRWTELDIEDYVQEAPSVSSVNRAPIIIADNPNLKIRKSEIYGKAGETNHIIILGRNDFASNVEYALFQDVAIYNIPSNRYGIFGPNHGFVALDLENVRFYPDTDVTDALAVRFSEITERAHLDRCDLSQLAANPFGNIKPNITWARTAFASWQTLEQSAAAAETVAWDGRSAAVVLSANAPTTITALTLPAGYRIQALPEVTLINASAHDITLAGGGNIEPRGSTAKIGTNQALRLIQRGSSGIWMPLSEPAPVSIGNALLAAVSDGVLISGATFVRDQTGGFSATGNVVSSSVPTIEVIEEGELIGVASFARDQTAGYSATGEVYT